MISKLLVTILFIFFLHPHLVLSQELDVKKHQVEAFLKSFKDRKVVLEVSDPNQKTILISEAYSYSNGSARFVDRYEPVVSDDGKQVYNQVDEFLIQPDSTQLKAECHYGKDKRFLGQSVTGVPDGRTRFNVEFFKYLVLGYFWTGKRNASLDEGLWNEFKPTISGNDLVAESEQGAKITFRFDGEKLACISYLPKEFENQPLEYHLIQEPTSGEISGWVTGSVATDKPFEKFATIEILSSDLLTKEQKRTETLRFEHVSVPDGSEVRMFGNSGMRLEYHDGQVFKVIDSDAETQIKELLKSSKSKSSKSKSSKSKSSNSKSSNSKSSKPKKEVEPPRTNSEPTQKDFSVNKTIKRSRYLSHSHETHCGAYSFCAVASVFGKDLSIAEIVSDADLGSPSGASVSGLIRKANEVGLFAYPNQHADYEFLKSLSSPALLHFGRSLQVERSSHWVALLGFENDKFKVLDLPAPPILVEPAVLMSYWDGTAVVIDDREHDSVSFLSLRRGHFIVFFAALSILIATTILFSRAKVLGEGRSRRLATILCSTGLLTLRWLFFSDVSYASNEFAVALSTAKAKVVEYDGEVTSDLTGMLESDPNEVLIVDCRYAAAFEIAHIPNSVSLPANCKLTELCLFKRQFDTNRKIFVYCDNAKCKFADHIAGLLKTLGFSNVKVYRPGWEGYVAKTDVVKE